MMKRRVISPGTKPPLRVAKESYPFILLLLLGAIITFFLYTYLSLFFFFLALFVAFFFRDPDRAVAYSKDKILSPADGRVVDIRRTTNGSADNTDSFQLVTIFLSLWDVHFTRSPIEGNVEKITYSRGGHSFAYHKDAFKKNENNLIHIKNETIEILVRQIAGKVARRIVCYCRKDQILHQGEKIGLIKFSSGTHLYVPTNVRIDVTIGQKVVAGITVIGTIT